MNKFKIHSLLCLTIRCDNPESLKNILLNGFGWDIFSESNIPQNLEKFFNLKESNNNNFSIFRSPKSDRGMVRILHGKERFRNKQRSLRWAGFEVVVSKDIDSLFNKLLKFEDFIPISPPENYDFTDVDSNIHRAFSAKLPGGTHATFTMKLSEPKNRLFPKSNAEVGHIFEIPLNTFNYEKTKNFYENTLGLTKILELVSNNGPLHKSWKIPVGEKYSIGIFKSSGSNSGFGSVEIHGCRKIFLDQELNNKNEIDGGACIATFSVVNINNLYEFLKKLDLVVTPIDKIEEHPYNGSLSFIIKGPNNEKIEFVEDWAI